MKKAATLTGRYVAALLAGCVIGTLGGLIGLGGAEFRLPLLIAVFSFVALEAVILNKAISLVVVFSALLFRNASVPFGEVLAHWSIILNLLAGSLCGAWYGASLATRLSTATLYRVISVLLALIAVVLVFGHNPSSAPTALAHGALLIALGVSAGLVIGIIASLLGVAGGEFLIPTLVLVFGIDVKLAGSLSLAISLPTMLVGLARYSRDQSFRVLRANATFAITMAAGSIAGSFLGALLLPVVSDTVLLPLLAAILWNSPASVDTVLT